MSSVPLSPLRDSPIPAVHIAEDDRIVDVNAAFEALCGTPAAAIRTYPFSQLLTAVGEGPDGYWDLVAGRVGHSTTIRQIAEGPSSGRRVRVQAWRHDGLLAVVEHLGEQEEAAASLTELASLVAHEVRNPLAGIGSALAVISERLPADGSEREIIAEIRGRLDRLNEQLDELLLLVRPIYVRRTTCDLVGLVQRAAQSVDRPVEAPVGPAVTADADEELVVRALRGLLDLVSEEGRTTRIAIEPGPDHVAVRVTGGRLAGDDGDSPVTWWTRARQDSLHVPVAQRVAQAHGGRLQVESDDGGLRLQMVLAQ